MPSSRRPTRPGPLGPPAAASPPRLSVGGRTSARREGAIRQFGHVLRQGHEDLATGVAHFGHRVGLEEGATPAAPVRRQDWPREFFFLLIRPPPRSTLFPYTTLFR